MELICSQLRQNGALGLIVVDTSALEVVERHYGVRAYRHCLRNLRCLVIETCRMTSRPAMS